jgi:hypothetical protein
VAKQYIVTEEEFMSLIESLELEALRKNNVMREDHTKPPTHADIHRAFHFVVVRWVQKMGFGGHRGA